MFSGGTISVMMGKDGTWTGSTWVEKWEEAGSGILCDANNGIYVKAGNAQFIVNQDNMLTVDKINTNKLSVGAIEDVEAAIGGSSEKIQELQNKTQNITAEQGSTTVDGTLTVTGGITGTDGAAITDGKSRVVVDESHVGIASGNNYITTAASGTKVGGDFEAAKGSTLLQVKGDYAQMKTGDNSVGVNTDGVVIKGDTAVQGDVNVSGTVEAAIVDTDIVDADIVGANVLVAETGTITNLKAANLKAETGTITSLKSDTVAAGTINTENISGDKLDIAATDGKVRIMASDNVGIQSAEDVNIAAGDKVRIEAENGVLIKSDVTMTQDVTINGMSNLKDTNVDGTLHVTGNTAVQGNQVVEGTQEVKGAATFDSGATVKGMLTADNVTAGTVTADDVSAGNVTVSEDLIVVGDTTVTNIDVQGNQVVEGTQEVKGAATFDSGATVKGMLTADNVTAGTVTADDVSAGNVTVSEDLIVVGDTTVTNIDVQGNQVVEGTQEVKGAATFDSGATVKGMLTADNVTAGTVTADDVSAGNVTVSNDLTVVGNTTVTDLDVSGNLKAGTIENVEQAITDNKNNIAQEISDRQTADNRLSSRIDSVDRNSKKGIAGVAALAALHPLDFDPDAKWDFAAGYGNYRGENAAAIGAYYRPNEDIMFSVGGTLGNSDNNSVNAGLSIKIGAGSSHVNNSKTAMAKEIKTLQESMSKLEAQNMKLAAMVNALLGANEQLPAANMFPDVPENHWAYEAVEAMVNGGLVEGYPDGEFKGDRSLTRYEFAQIIANARQKGAEIDARLLHEFQPELQYFHIDAVHHDKDGNATVERVRVNK